MKLDALDRSRRNAATPWLVSRLPWHTLLLAAALLLLYIPTFRDVSSTVWNRDDQPPGPVLLALSMWLLYRKWGELGAVPYRPAWFMGSAALGAGLFAYLIGRSLVVLQLEVGSLIPILTGLLLLQKGWKALRVVWFPLFFLIFVIPVPGIIAQTLTLPLKSGVSWAVENLLYAAGYPVARAGVTLSIAQYRLLVADACAGLNSLFVLEALGLLYLNLMNYTSGPRNVLLAICIVPISFVANVVRVSVLVLVTYYLGDEIAQGYLHKFAGMVLFVTALVLILMTDSVLGRLLSGLGRRHG